MKGRELLRARKSESREPGKDSEEEEAVSLSEREMECREEKRWREGGGWRVAGGDKRDGKCRRMFIS